MEKQDNIKKMIYRGEVHDRLSFLPVRKTKWYESYQGAHIQAELLGHKHYGADNMRWNIVIVDKEVITNG